MALTPETLPRHELNGLRVRVVDAADPGLIGIEGRVVVETTNTLHVDGVRRVTGTPSAGGDGDRERRVRQLPKRGTTFEFALTDETADGHEASSSDQEDAREGSGTTTELPGGAGADPDADATGSDRAGEARAASGDAAGTAAPVAGGEDVAYVTVAGARLVSRPAERTERDGDSIWR